MFHTHHIIPKHMGGTDDPSNLIELTVAEHAEAHKKLFEEHGKLEDKLAWIGLSNQIDNQEVIRQRQSLGGKNGSKELKRAGGSIAGKKAKENKTGIFAPENIGMGGRIGGKIGGPKGMAIVNAMKYQCNDCEYTSRPRWVLHHINKTGHTGYTKL